MEVTSGLALRCRKGEFDIFTRKWLGSCHKEGVHRA
jgi:hypothetical protein